MRLDWALLDHLPANQSKRPNKVLLTNPYTEILIREMASSSVCGEITVLLADPGPQIGYLHSSPMTLKVNSNVLDVQLITLERALRKSL